MTKLFVLIGRNGHLIAQLTLGALQILAAYEQGGKVGATNAAILAVQIYAADKAYTIVPPKE
jgi:hypothetical protein